MASPKSGSVQLGTQDSRVAMPDGGGIVWTHDQGVIPIAVNVYGSQGQVIIAPNVTFDITDPAIIEISNSSGGPLDVIIEVIWQLNTVGVAGVIRGDDPSIVTY